MSRSITRHKNSFRTNSDSDNDLQSSFSRPTSAINKNNEESDGSYEFKAKPKSFIERITGSVKYSSDSDESVTRTPSIDKKESKNEKFSRPHSRLKSSSSSTDDVSISSDRPAPKNNQTLRSSSRTNSNSSEKRRPLDTKSNKNSDNDSKKNRNKQRKRSSSSSSTSSYSKSDSTLSSVKKNIKHTDTSDDDYHSSSGHVTKVKVNEKKPPIDMSKRNKSSRPSSSLEKPSGDSMSDSSDTRRSNSITDSPSKSSQYKQRFKNDRKLNKTFDLELENDSSSNEMTDVSPLPTPKNKSDKTKTSKIKSDKEPRRNSMDMSSFYKILNEDINKRMDSVFSIFNDKHAKNSLHKSSLKTTSFDKNLNANIEINNRDKLAARMNKIEAENQRLYEKLMNTTQNNMTNNRFEVNKPIRLTSSALNRQREQQRIERENQQILKRLLKVKATKNLVKEEQIKDYDKNFGLSSLNYSRAGSSNSMPSGFLSSASSIAAASHNTSLLSTKRSVKSTANNSRLSSAKSTSKSRQQITNIDTNELLRRATSASRSRPEWMDRW